MRKQPAKSEPNWFHCARYCILRARAKNNSLAQRFFAIKRSSRDDESTARPFKVARHQNECSAPIRDRNFDGLASERAQPFVEGGSSEHLRAITIAAGERRRAIDLRRRQ